MYSSLYDAMYLHSLVPSEGIPDVCVLTKIGVPFIVGLKLESEPLKLWTLSYTSSLRKKG